MSVTSDEIKKLIEEVHRVVELVADLNYRLSAVIDDVVKLKAQRKQEDE